MHEESNILPLHSRASSTKKIRKRVSTQSLEGRGAAEWAANWRLSCPYFNKNQKQTPFSEGYDSFKICHTVCFKNAWYWGIFQEQDIFGPPKEKDVIPSPLPSIAWTNMCWTQAYDKCSEMKQKNELILDGPIKKHDARKMLPNNNKKHLLIGKKKKDRDMVITQTNIE